jgi:hypothetical protein
LRTNFGISAAFSWRRFNDVIWTGTDLSSGLTVYPLVGVTRDDYVLEQVIDVDIPGLVTAREEVYTPIVSELPPGNGAEYRNRPGYHQQYFGFEVQATKRLANRWMARVGFSTSTHREYLDDPALAVQDPTSTTIFPNNDGQAIMTPSFGSGKSEVYLLSPRYQFNAAGLYQLPYGVNVAANLVARDGFGQPHFATVESSDPSAPEKRVLLVDPEDTRLPGVVSFDVRVGKSFNIRGSELALDLDIFNVLNQSTVLGRQYDVTATGSTGFNQPLGIMNPRLFRLGVRYRF